MRNVRKAAFDATAALVLATSSLGFASSPSAGPSSEAQAGARALESRLYAPCCYGGTLDVHDSELAHDLRKEIEARLAAGETTDGVQADMVRRYGERVLAARSDRPIAVMGLALAAVLAAAAGALAVMLRRWTKKAAPATQAARPEGPPDDLDARIDAELSEMS